MTNVLMILFSIFFGGIFAYKPLLCTIQSKNKRVELSKYKHQFILAGIIIFGCLFRTVALGSLPAGLNQDEASIGYEAFSLAGFGIDRNGISLPVHFISWGSGQNAFYAYLLIPFIKLFGLSVFTLRLPMAIFGCVSIYIFYFVIKRLLPKYEILGTFFFVINPWHIEKSRWALEANIFPDLFLLGFLLFLIAINGKKIYYVLSGVVFALATYSYGTSYFVLPIFCIATLGVLLLKKQIKFSHCVMFLATIFAVSLPMIIFVLLNYSSYESVSFLGFTIPKLFQNRQTFILNLSDNFFATFFANAKTALEIVFVQTDGLVWNGMDFFGLTYVITTPFMLLGLYKSIKDKSIKELPMLCWFFTALAMLFLIEANINRGNILYIPMIYFTIKGLSLLFEIKSLQKSIKTMKVLVGGFLCVLFISFGFCYFGNTHQDSLAFQFFDGAGDAMVVASENYDSVYVTSSINQPYITYLFYLEISPYEYLETREVYNPYDSFEYISQINNFTFFDVDVEDLKEGECYIAFSYVANSLDEEIYSVEYYDEFVIIAKK